jgi:serine/threonine protein phosphatase PrpC
MENTTDAMLCEAIRKACVDIDSGISEISGTTVNSLFLQWLPGPEGKGPAGSVGCPVKVFCSNIGDSRCVMLKSYDTKDALTLSSNSQKMRNDNRNNNENEKNERINAALQRGDSENIPHERRDSLRDSKVSKSVQSFFKPPQPSSSSNKEKKNNRFVAIHLMSEDHKLNVILYMIVCLFYFICYMCSFG